MSSDPINNPQIPAMLVNGIIVRPPSGEKNTKTLFTDDSGQKAGHSKGKQSQSENVKKKTLQKGSPKHSCHFVDTVILINDMENKSLASLQKCTSVESVGSGKSRGCPHETLSTGSSKGNSKGNLTTSNAVLLHGRRIRAQSAVLDSHTKRIWDGRSKSQSRPNTALGRVYSNTSTLGISSSCMSLFSNSNSRLEDALTKLKRESQGRRLDRTVSAPSSGRTLHVPPSEEQTNGNYRSKRAASTSGGSTTSSIFARRPKTMWKFMKDHRKDAVMNVKQKRKRAKQLFRWAINMVNMVMYYQRSMVKISQEASKLSAIESQWYTLHVSTESQTLVFNPANFAQKKGLTRIPRWAKSILDTPPSERTPDDCRKIHALLRGLKNFDKFTEKIQMAMCQAFAYYRVQPMRVILRKGHIGHNFYFIYSGSVFVNIEETDNAGEMFSKTEAVLSKGDSFGEIALLKDVPRTATITCREECELLVVDKEVFSKVCPKIFDIELEEKSQFIRNLALFHPKYWKHDVIRKLSFEALIQEYKTGKIVSQSSAHDEWLYICMEGSCRIVKCLSYWDKESHKRENLGEDELSIEFIENMKNKGHLTESGDNNNNNLQVKHSAHAQNKNLEGSHVRFNTIAEEHDDSLSFRKGSFSKRHRPSIVRRSMSAQSDGSGRGSANLQSKRDQMFSALDLEHVSSPVKTKRPPKWKIQEMMEENTKRYNEFQRNGNVTLTSLIRQKIETSEGMNEFVYLDIGRLNSGEIFDLAELLVPTDTTVKSSLILVSAGAKLLKIKKSLVLSSMTSEGLEHAKHLARNSLYPTNEVLVNSIKEKQLWEDYKTEVFDETIKPYKHLKRHSQAVKLLGKSTKQRDRQLICGLQADVNQNKDMQLVDVNDFDNPLGDDPNIEEEFESMMLMNATAIHEKLKIKPMMPSSVNRRSSFAGGRGYICTPTTM